MPKIGKMLVDKEYVPELVLCSSAQRTLETWGGIEPYTSGCPMEVRDDLYESTTGRYLAAIHSVKGNAPLMLIGHNPVCDDLTRLLITGDGLVAAEFLPTHYPTGGFAAIDLNATEWGQVTPTTGNMVDFVRPRML